ncbi:uncharacterized protein LOC135466239 isoform X2 [Liolophura sinensis]|uniref:uncharacterized protein LOC135466239 isoform X2 n=1 Tax=Liolophura sinensis TaxID=3198878 RepID=UPI003157FB71
MASPIVLSSDESEDEVVVVCETKAAPKDLDEDGDVVFLSIEKSDGGTTNTGHAKTNHSDVASLATDNSHATPLTSDSSDVTPLTSDSSDVTPLTSYSSDVTPLNTDILCTTPVDTNSLNVVTPVVAITSVQHVSSKQVKVEVLGDSCASRGQRASSWAVVGSQTVSNVSTVLSQRAQPLLNGSEDSADHIKVTSYKGGAHTVHPQSASPPLSCPSQSCPQFYLADSASVTTCSPTPSRASSSVVSPVTLPATAADSALDKTNQMFTNWLLQGADSGGVLPVAESSTCPAKTSVKSSLSRSFSSTYPSADSASHSSLLSPHVSVELSGCTSPQTTRLISDQRNVPLRKRLRSDGELGKPWCKLHAPGGTGHAGWSTRCSVCGEEERKVSCCMQGHQTCCICLEERAKYLLSDKKGTTLKCLSVGCESFYPMSELKHTLPGMVVDVLEIQLEKHYVDYLADMVMKEVDSAAGEVNISQDDDDLKDSKSSAGAKIKNECMEVPSSWIDMEPQTPFLLVQLEPETEAYVSVSLKFHETMKFGSIDIEKIYRVQNPILWKFYSVKKQQMSQDHEGEMVEEKLLFHGTNDDAVDAICKSGFDWRLCGKHGTMYGQGSYFAQTASYSHQYSAAAKVNRRGRHPLTGLLGGKVRACKIKIPKLPKKSSASSPQAMQLNNYTFLSSSAGVNPTTSGPYSSGLGGLTMSSVAGGQFPAPCVLPPSSPVSHSMSSATHGSSIGSHGSSVFTSSSTTPAGTGGPQTLSWPPSQPNPLNLSMSSYSTPSSTAPPNVALSSPLGAHCSSALSSLSTNASLTVPGMTGFYLPHAFLANVVSSQATAANLGFGSAPALGGTGSKQVSSSALLTDSDAPVFKMFLARVLVGTYTTGNNDLRKPPPLDPVSDPYGRCFDSCVDNVISPKIFVVFDSAQAYPEYIVHYKENVS